MLMKAMQIEPTLNFLGRLGEYTLPSKLGFAISVNFEELSKWQKHIEKERIKLLEGYADRDDDGKIIMDKNADGQDTYRLSDENLKLFTMEYGEFLETELDVDLRMVEEDILWQCDENPKYRVLTVGELSALRFMVKE